MMKRLHLVLPTLCILTLVLSACGGEKLSAEEIAATMVIETFAAVSPVVSPTLAPTDTLTPVPTGTPTPTAVPSITPEPTKTPIPSDTPTPTATPGPFTLFDDFAKDTGAWENCQYCTWENDALTMGPFPPSSVAVHTNLCSGCGTYTTYHMSVEGAFIDGQVDRFFGIVFGMTETSGYYLGISPWQMYIILEYHRDGDWWEVLEVEWSGAVNASYATNTFEVRVQPGAQTGTVDTFLYLNDTLIFTRYNQPARGAQVGLAMNFHDVTVSYDNFIFEEIEAAAETP
jgi:hypothetical protein